MHFAFAAEVPKLDTVKTRGHKSDPGMNKNKKRQHANPCFFCTSDAASQLLIYLEQ